MKNTNQGKLQDVTDALDAWARIADVHWDPELQPEEWIPVNKSTARTDRVLDAVVNLTVQGHHLKLGVEFRRHVRRSMLGNLHEQLDHAEKLYGIPVMLCTDYVESGLADALKDAGIQFLDKAGNVSLNTEGIFIFVKGQAKPVNVHRREKSGRAFQSAGLKLVFELLRDPRLAEKPYRELADRAQISLYAVKCAMDDLIDKAYIVSDGKQRRLNETKRLLDEWCVAYRDRLRPELVRGTYEAGNPDWWQNIDIDLLPACWGGEIAAAKLELMRRPQVHTIYCHGNVNALIAAGKLHRKDAGNVELLDAFWHAPGNAIAPDLLIYADLITSGVERNIQAAKDLYDRRIEDVLT